MSEKPDDFKSYFEKYKEGEDRRPESKKLLETIKAKLPEIKELLESVNDDMWGMEDMIYRFYHQSFKVFRIQEYTKKMVALIKIIGGDAQLNEWFEKIIEEGTNKEFSWASNDKWLEETRPLLEAFFHAKYFVEMMAKYGAELEVAPQMLPSGWASVLYLYSMR
jgi:hypothetical protein